MLLTKMVIIKWGYRIKKYYIDKGYVFTNINDEFEVKVEDLSKGSEVLVNVKCDCEDCKNPYLKPIMWKVYKKCLKDNEKYYCKDCALRLYGSEKARKTKLKNGKSFEAWCIENNRQDVLERWDYELNDCKPNEINYSTRIKYHFKCPKGIHNSELKSIGNFVNGHEGVMYCKQCNSFAQWGIDNYGSDFLEKYWSNKNTLNPWEIDKASDKTVWIKCQEKDYHDDYKTRFTDFFKGNRCSYCANRLVHPKDSLGQYIVDNYGQEFLNLIWSKKNDKSAFEYSPYSGKKVWWRCIEGKHKDYCRTVRDSIQPNFRCPNCSRERKESILQEKVRLYLEQTDYTILHENNCTIIPKNPKYNGSQGEMPFDNEIKELKLIIEVNGKQHYKVCGFHIISAKRNNVTPKYELHMQQVRDRYKRIKAIQNEYYYLEIPYWADDKNETWKQLINDKLKEISILEEVI